MMKRLVGSSQSESWAILAVGLVWILGGIVLVVLVVLLSVGWLKHYNPDSLTKSLKLSKAFSYRPWFGRYDQILPKRP